MNFSVLNQLLEKWLQLLDFNTIYNLKWTIKAILNMKNSQSQLPLLLKNKSRQMVMKKKNNSRRLPKKMKEKRKFLNFSLKNINGQFRTGDQRTYQNCSMAVKDLTQSMILKRWKTLIKIHKKPFQDVLMSFALNFRMLITLINIFISKLSSLKLFDVSIFIYSTYFYYII